MPDEEMNPNPDQEAEEPSPEEPTEEDALAEIKSMLSEILDSIRGGEQLEKDAGYDGVTEPGEENTAKPAPAGNGGKPTGDVSSKVEQESLEKIKELKDELTELKKSINSKAVNAIRAPVETTEPTSDPLELRKSMTAKILNGEKISTKDILAGMQGGM